MAPCTKHRRGEARAQLIWQLVTMVNNFMNCSLHTIPIQSLLLLLCSLRLVGSWYHVVIVSITV